MRAVLFVLFCFFFLSSRHLPRKKIQEEADTGVMHSGWAALTERLQTGQPIRSCVGLVVLLFWGGFLS